MSCSEVSLALGEPLGGTATQAARWLAVEHPAAWGRDAIADTELPAAVRELLQGFEGRVVLMRRPGRRRGGVTVFHADVDETKATLRRAVLKRLEDLAEVDPAAGDPVPGPLVLVCGHGRRDPCCARLGVPVFDALAAHVPPQLLWQSSHLGGHRFAANVVALPAGVQLGRVSPSEARAVAALLAAGRIPLERYRGRTLHPPVVQAAEVEVRRAFGLDRVDDVALVAHEGALVRFAVPGGPVEATVTERPGPPAPASCGADPEPTVRFAVRLASAAARR